jgi:hypothetical protein
MAGPTMGEAVAQCGSTRSHNARSLLVAGKAFCSVASLELSGVGIERATPGKAATVVACHVSERRAAHCPELLPHIRRRSSKQPEWLTVEGARRWARQACWARCCRARDRRRRMSRQKSVNAASSLSLRGCLFAPEVGVQRRRAPAAAMPAPFPPALLYILGTSRYRWGHSLDPKAVR